MLQISSPQQAPPPEEQTCEEEEPSPSSGQAASSDKGHKLVPDGQVLHVQGELLILAVGNGRQAGGGMRLCPYAGKHAYYVTSPLCTVLMWTAHLVQQKGRISGVIACCAVNDMHALHMVMCWSKCQY